MGHFSILSAHLFCIFMIFKTRVKLNIWTVFEIVKYDDLHKSSMIR